ncbi:MAG: nitroreductase family protein [Novosphingobium sp.]|nr:nitroreductase family protein [Novosphingobium sp.]
MKFDLDQTDALLTTTRAVRKRLDLNRPVEREVILECLQLATQAPTGSNQQGWRFMVVEDADKREKIASFYAQAAGDYLSTARDTVAAEGDQQTTRVYDSALWLIDNLAKVPVFVIPCIEGRPPADAPNVMQASQYGSIFPAVWSFQLALRSRGLGTVLTTLHLMHEGEISELLGIPEEIMQVALLPVAYTKGTDFKRASRPPVETITHWDSW